MNNNNFKTAQFTVILHQPILPLYESLIHAHTKILVEPFL